MPQNQKPARRFTIKKILVFAACMVAMATVVFRHQLLDAFGPMEQDELQCLICHRERVQKWVCDTKVQDEIITNQYSEWIDSFVPSTHEHIWMTHTHYSRSRWFGGTSIACGGIPTIPRIFDQRNKLGESELKKLALQFHQLVSRKSPQDELARFEEAVIQNPNSLLNPGD